MGGDIQSSSWPWTSTSLNCTFTSDIVSYRSSVCFIYSHYSKHCILMLTLRCTNINRLSVFLKTPTSIPTTTPHTEKIFPFASRLLSSHFQKYLPQSCPSRSYVPHRICFNLFIFFMFLTTCYLYINVVCLFFKQ